MLANLPPVVNTETVSKKSKKAHALPPLLIGGVIHSGKMNKIKGFDYLSLSVSHRIGEMMLPATYLIENPEKLHKDGRYNKSEKRSVLGGEITRHYEPKCKNKHGRTDYELWHWSGSNTLSAFAMLPRWYLQEIKCTRIDIAFDIWCSAETSPTDMIETCRKTIEANKYSIGCSGKEPVEAITRTIGYRGGEKYLRIYRKDIERAGDGNAFRSDQGDLVPLMRFELELRGDPCLKLFKVAYADEGKAMDIAIRHIKNMIGFTVDSSSALIPERTYVPDSNVAMKMASAINQYGRMFEALRRTGVCIDKLLDERLESVTRNTRYRDRQFINEMKSIHPDELIKKAIEAYQNRT